MKRYSWLQQVNALQLPPTSKACPAYLYVSSDESVSFALIVMSTLRDETTFRRSSWQDQSRLIPGMNATRQMNRHW